MLRVARILSIGYLFIAALAALWTFTGKPLGAALVPIGPAREPIVVTLAYGTEKREWLEQAVVRFAAEDRRINGRPIQIELQGIGSRELVTEIVGGQLQPTVISPASTIQMELLRSEWQARNGADIVGTGTDAPQPLVLTPLVLVMWEQRAQALWPNGPQQFWPELHDALADPNGWAARGHGEWGFVKFGHTSPQTSNSGMQTLVLLAYAYHNKTTDLTSANVLDPQFQQWLAEFELAVMEFGDSTGTFMDNMVRFGPSKYDAVLVYENLAVQNVEAAQGRWGPIRVYYPPATIISDHPYAVLNAPWVTAEQQQAAAMFRDCLLAEPTQQLALQYGFRPANADVSISNNDGNNPFNALQGYGLQVDIQQQVAVPPADVLTSLLDLWRRQINK